MTDMTIPEALDKLAAEGDADQIAAFLREQGHQGAWESSDASLTCPVARYVTATTGRQVHISRSGWAMSDDWLVTGSHPEAVRDFVRAYDRKDYPELIEDGTDE